MERLRGKPERPNREKGRTRCEKAMVRDDGRWKRVCVVVREKEEEVVVVVGVTQEERSAGIREVALCACILDNGILVIYYGILFLPAFSALCYSLEYQCS